MCHSPSDATLEELFTQRADLTYTQDTGIQMQKRAHPTRPQQQLANKHHWLTAKKRELGRLSTAAHKSICSCIGQVTTDGIPAQREWTAVKESMPIHPGCDRDCTVLY